jgi:hypothetical protein
MHALQRLVHRTHQKPAEFVSFGFEPTSVEEQLNRLCAPPTLALVACANKQRPEPGGFCYLLCLSGVLQYHPLTRSFSQGNRNSGSGERVLSPQSSYKSNQEAATDEAAEQQQPQTPRDLRVGKAPMAGKGKGGGCRLWHCHHTAYTACPVGPYGVSISGLPSGLDSRNRQQRSDCRHECWQGLFL